MGEQTLYILVHGVEYCWTIEYDANETITFLIENVVGPRWGNLYSVRRLLYLNHFAPYIVYSSLILPPNAIRSRLTINA